MTAKRLGLIAFWLLSDALAVGGVINFVVPLWHDHLVVMSVLLAAISLPVLAVFAFITWGACVGLPRTVRETLALARIYFILSMLWAFHARFPHHWEVVFALIVALCVYQFSERPAERWLKHSL